MRVKEFSISSFVVAVTLGCGIAVGYVWQRMECDDFRRQAEHRGFTVNGEWVHVEDFEAFLRSRTTKPVK